MVLFHDEPINGEVFIRQRGNDQTTTESTTNTQETEDKSPLEYFQQQRKRHNTLNEIESDMEIKPEDIENNLNDIMHKMKNSEMILMAALDADGVECDENFDDEKHSNNYNVSEYDQQNEDNDDNNNAIDTNQHLNILKLNYYPINHDITPTEEDEDDDLKIRELMGSINTNELVGSKQIDRSTTSNLMESTTNNDNITTSDDDIITTTASSSDNSCDSLNDLEDSSTSQLSKVSSNEMVNVD